MVADILRWIPNFHPLLIHLLLLNCAIPLTSQPADIPGKGIIRLTVKGFIRSFFPSFTERIGQHERPECLGRGRNNRRDAGKGDRIQTYTSCFSILARGSDAIIHSFIYSIIKHLLSVKNLLFFTLLLTKKELLCYGLVAQSQFSMETCHRPKSYRITSYRKM